MTKRDKPVMMLIPFRKLTITSGRKRRTIPATLVGASSPPRISR